MLPPSLLAVYALIDRIESERRTPLQRSLLVELRQLDQADGKPAIRVDTLAASLAPYPQGSGRPCVLCGK